MNSSGGIPHVENIHELLLLPSSLFLRVAYQRVLRREADEAGFLNYMNGLSQGLGKDSILISLMNSAEAQQLNNANKSGVASANSDLLLREIAQLCEVHNRNRIVHRILLGRRSRAKRKELNALEFKLERMFLTMIDQVKSEISHEITYRLDIHHQVNQHPLDLHHEVDKPAQNNSGTVKVIQARRRLASRPGSEG